MLFFYPLKKFSFSEFPTVCIYIVMVPILSNENWKLLFVNMTAPFRRYNEQQFSIYKRWNLWLNFKKFHEIKKTFTFVGLTQMFAV